MNVYLRCWILYIDSTTYVPPPSTLAPGCGRHPHLASHARALQGIKDRRGVARDMARTKQTARRSGFDPHAPVPTFEVPAPPPPEPSPPPEPPAPEPPPAPKAEEREPLRAYWMRVWRAEQRAKGNRCLRRYWLKRWKVVGCFFEDGIKLRIRRKREPKRKTKRVSLQSVH